METQLDKMIFTQRRFMGLLLANLYGWHHRFTSLIDPPAHSINTWTICNGGAIDEMNASLNKWQKITKACYLNSRFSLPRNAQSKIPTRKWWQHWILKMMMIFQRNEWNAMQMDWWVNASVFGPFQHHILKASCMPFVWNSKHYQ